MCVHLKLPYGQLSALEVGQVDIRLRWTSKILAQRKPSPTLVKWM